ncbi:VOC family protein [Pararhizobium mangrovi]|uniref:Glutathione transferase n=1 Tax=Pararhizobium mangrovi TaxID=2590452 RepID=A0A506U0P9_9HYPH|nr:VOC family protein [Pararhizobium mangrovi]TPW27058.1 glutathione transferase [Pararhizobium mangrovi]
MRGLNHVTLAVADLTRSLAFYRDLLGMRLRALWDDGAYLEAGSLWLCLSYDAAAGPRADYTHIAFDVSEADLAAFAERAKDAKRAVRIWKDNRSEGASLYLLDPDGHKLELHVGLLESRLSHYRNHPSPGRRIFD